MPLNKVIGALVGAWVVALIGGVAASTGVELSPEDVSGAGAWVAGAVTAGVGAFIAAYFTPENVRKLVGYLRASKGRVVEAAELGADVDSTRTS